MTEQLRLTLFLDTSRIEAWSIEVSALLPKIADRAPHLLHRLVGLIESGAQLFIFERDLDAASGTDDLRMVAKPSEGLAVLVSALRTGDIDLALVEQAFCHLERSSAVMGGIIATSPPTSPDAEHAEVGS